MGEEGQAVKLYKRCLELRLKLYGENHRLVATTLNNMGVAYAGQHHFKEALACHEKALAVRRDLYGDKDHADTAWSLRNIGWVYHAQGKYEDALRFEQDALAMLRRLHADRPDITLADMLEGVGVTLNELGRYDEALAHYGEALQILEKLDLKEGPETANVLANMGAAYTKKGDLTKALSFHRDALLRRQKRHPGGRHPDIAHSFAGLGYLYLETGEYAKAIEAHETALSIRSQFFLKADVASSLNNLGVCWMRVGDYVRAQQEFENALATWREIGLDSHAATAFCHDNLATILVKVGRHREALQHQTAALAILEKAYRRKHPDIATCLNGLGYIHSQMGKTAQARKYFEEALEIQERLPGRSWGAAVTLSNLASLALQKDDLETARKHFESAEQLACKALGATHPFVADCANHLSWILFQRGEHEQALAKANEALTASLLPGIPKPGTFEALRTDDINLSKISVQVLLGRGAILEESAKEKDRNSRLREAAAMYALGSAVARKLREGPIGEETSRLQLGEEAHEIAPRWLGVLKKLYDLESNPKDLETAVGVIEQSAARLFAEQLGRTLAYQARAKSGDFHEPVGVILGKLKNTRERLARENAKPLQDRSSERAGALMKELKEWDDRLHELMSGKDESGRRAAEFLYPRPCSLAEARATLREGELAILFAPGTKASYAVIIEGKPNKADPANGLAIVALPPAAELAERVAVLTDTDTLASPVRTREAAAKAFASILGPFKDRLKNKDLVILPGGELGLLPFELLLDNDQYVVENHRIRYAPSLTVLHYIARRNQNRRAAVLPLFAVGDPVYGNTEFARLEHSRKEVEKIAALLRAQADDILVGEQATKSRFLQSATRAGKARFIHFATHGVRSDGASMQPALVLGQEKGKVGFLEMNEIARLQLNADLAVLSACDSGQGQLYHSEGIRGLARAFLHAGCQGVLCSLWSVDDRETAEMMTALYRRLTEENLTAADALRAAQRHMIQNDKPPLHWAPFILIGD